MSQPFTPGPRPGVARSGDEQRADLDAVREQLGETVEELSRRVDVPARVRARRDEALARARRFAEQARAVAARVPVPPVLRQNAGFVAAGVGILLAGLLVRRRRHT